MAFRAKLGDATGGKRIVRVALVLPATLRTTEDLEASEPMLFDLSKRELTCSFTRVKRAQLDLESIYGRLVLYMDSETEKQVLFKFLDGLDLCTNPPSDKLPDRKDSTSVDDKEKYRKLYRETKELYEAEHRDCQKIVSLLKEDNAKLELYIKEKRPLIDHYRSKHASSRQRVCELKARFQKPFTLAGGLQQLDTRFGSLLVTIRQLGDKVTDVQLHRESNSRLTRENNLLNDMHEAGMAREEAARGKAEVLQGVIGKLRSEVQAIYTQTMYRVDGFRSLALSLRLKLKSGRVASSLAKTKMRSLLVKIKAIRVKVPGLMRRSDMRLGNLQLRVAVALKIAVQFKEHCLREKGEYVRAVKAKAAHLPEGVDKIGALVCKQSSIEDRLELISQRVELVLVSSRENQQSIQRYKRRLETLRIALTRYQNSLDRIDTAVGTTSNLSAIAGSLGSLNDLTKRRLLNDKQRSVNSLDSIMVLVTKADFTGLSRKLELLMKNATHQRLSYAAIKSENDQLRQEKEELGC